MKAGISTNELGGSISGSSILPDGAQLNKAKSSRGSTNSTPSRIIDFKFKTSKKQNINTISETFGKNGTSAPKRKQDRLNYKSRVDIIQVFKLRYCSKLTTDHFLDKISNNKIDFEDMLNTGEDSESYNFVKTLVSESNENFNDPDDADAANDMEEIVLENVNGEIDQINSDKIKIKKMLIEKQRSATLDGETVENPNVDDLKRKPSRFMKSLYEKGTKKSAKSKMKKVIIV
jgi:hypothetical protein